MESGIKVELLAPAGSPEGFYGAIHAGADAVYLAGNKFGARAYAENFTEETLLECIRYGHLFGRKIYLTVNTLLKDSELGELYDYLLPFYEAGLDAAIVQDLGVFRFIREHFPDLRLHVSTQMTICSGYGASLLKAMGAERIIPARELGLQELIAMKRHSNVEIETFIHGAMCYCYSGQCLFSSIAGGRSGNRGRCAQPCRLPYSVGTERGKSQECYPLSLKDMCTVEKLPRLIEAGIDSFKIEGRMKKPEYAAGVTKIYRQYIDKYYALREEKGAQGAADAYRVEKEDLEFLSSLYIRSELQDGYYFRRNGRSMITLNSPSYKGSEESLLDRLREEYILTPRKLPVSLKAIFLPGRPAELSMVSGESRASVKGAVVEQAKKQPVTEENIRKQLGKLGDTSFYAEKIEIEAGEDCFYPLKQINELRREAVALLEEQILLDKGYPLSADNPHSAKSVPCDASEENARSANDLPSVKSTTCDALGGYAFLVSTLEQLRAVTDWLSREERAVPLRIYVDADLVYGDWEEVQRLCGRALKKCTFFMALPYILRQDEEEFLETIYARASSPNTSSGNTFFGNTSSGNLFRGFLVRSMDGLGFLREKQSALPCRTDAGVYVWNQAALKQVEALEEGFCLPYELKASEQFPLLGKLPCEKIVYGRIPMMITANCVLRTMGQCRRMGKKLSGEGADMPVFEPGRATLTDRHRRQFPVSVHCSHCVNIIYNTVPLSLHQELAKWQGRADLRLDFTLESAGEVEEILDVFWGVRKARHDPEECEAFFEAGVPAFLRKGYTTGHEKRGVE